MRVQCGVLNNQKAMTNNHVVKSDSVVCHVSSHYYGVILYHYTVVWDIAVGDVISSRGARAGQGILG